MADDERRRKRSSRANAGKPARGGRTARQERPPEHDQPAAGGTSPAPENTSWDPVASWYTGWVGARGSIYHRKSGLPTVLRLAAPAPGENLIDIGCGHGVLARP